MIFILFYVIGDFAFVYAGFAIQRVDKEVAEEALKYIRQISDETGGLS